MTSLTFKTKFRYSHQDKPIQLFEIFITFPEEDFLVSNISNLFVKRFLISILLLVSFVMSAYAHDVVPGKASDINPIKVGQSLPELVLTDVDGKAFHLNKVVAKKPTVLIFYRGSWCPYCNAHLGELKNIEQSLLDLGYQIIAVSPDLPINLKKSIDKNELKYTLLSDSKAEAVKALGLAFTVDAATYKKYLDHNINLEEASGEKHHILPAPAAMVLNQEGVVQFIFVSPDYKVRVKNRVLLVAAEEALEK